MDTPLNDHQSRSSDGGDLFVESVSALDRDLRQRLDAVEAERAAGAERFGTARPMVMESLAWAFGAAAIWAIVVVMWR